MGCGASSGGYAEEVNSTAAEEEKAIGRGQKLKGIERSTASMTARSGKQCVALSIIHVIHACGTM